MIRYSTRNERFEISLGYFLCFFLCSPQLGLLVFLDVDAVGLWLVSCVTLDPSPYSYRTYSTNLCLVLPRNTDALATRSSVTAITVLFAS